MLGLIVGFGVTLFSALIPAVRATKIPPMAGLREGATLPRGRFARFSPILAALFALGGALLIANGVTGSGEPPASACSAWPAARSSSSSRSR